MSIAESDEKSTSEGVVETPVDVTDPIQEGGTEEVAGDDRPDNVRRLLPVHAAPNTGKNSLKVDRQRGRPRKVERMPTTSDLEYHAEMSEEKTRFIDQDPVYKAAVGKCESSEILHIIKSQVAREAAALEFQRIENEKFGRDTAQISTRRIDALTKIANIELEIKKLGGDILDLRGEKFQRIFKLLIGKFETVAGDVLQPEQVDLLFNRLSTEMEGWEEEVAVAVAGKGPDKK